MSMRRRSVSPVLLLLAAVAPACGGAVGSSLLDGTREVDAGTPQGGDSGPATRDSGAGQPVDAWTPPGDSGGGVIDTGAPVDVFTQPETGPTGPAVVCATANSSQTCAPGQICCITGDPQNVQTAVCDNDKQSCQGTVVSCATQADCPGGQICCGSQQTVNGVTIYTDLSCAQSCNGQNQRVFCDPNQQPSACPQWAPSCGPSGLLPGYSVCQ